MAPSRVSDRRHPRAHHDPRLTIAAEPRVALAGDLTTYGAAETAALRAAAPAKRVGEKALQSGDRVAGRYTLLARVGAGSQGEVWTVDDALLGERAALKWLGPSTAASTSARREIAVLRMLRVPGVAQL